MIYRREINITASSYMLCCVLSFLHALFKKMQQASLVAQMVKNPPAMQETWFYPWFKKMPWRRKWQPTPIFLPGEFYGQRRLAGYSPWGCKESDTAERLTHHNKNIDPQNDYYNKEYEYTYYPHFLTPLLILHYHPYLPRHLCHRLKQTLHCRYRLLCIF